MSNPSGWDTPKTDWATDDGIGTADLNLIGTNAQATETGNRTVDQSQNPTNNTASLQDYIDESAHQLDAIIGKTNWYDAPDMSLAEIDDDIDTINDNISDAESKIWTSARVGGSAAQLISGAEEMQSITVTVPAHTSLVVERACYRLTNKLMYLWVSASGTAYPGGWVSESHAGDDAAAGDESPTSDNEVYSNASTNAKDIEVFVSLYNELGANAETYDGWSIKLGFEPYDGTTTTTSGA